tara:strand:- start:4433 stop:6802 length:2370 start_codon:yes stop_codon:yes gene_type:complete
MTPETVFEIESMFSHRARHKIIAISNIVLALLVVVLAVTFFVDIFEFIFRHVLGVFLITFSISVIFVLLEYYFQSFYFRSSISSFEFGRINYKSINTNEPLLYIVLASDIGRRIMLRAGIPLSEVEQVQYKRERMHFSSMDEIVLTANSLQGLFVELFQQEPLLRGLFSEHNIVNAEQVKGLVDWVVLEQEVEKDREWWWSKNHLSDLRGIGRQWAYPITWKLDAYGKTLTEDPSIYISGHYSIRKDSMRLLGSILSKDAESNALVIGLPGIGKKEFIKNFAHKVATGNISKKLAFRRVVSLSGVFVVGSVKTKGELEEKILTIFEEAHSAGNIILVINDLPEFMGSAQALGVNVAALIEPYLGSKKMQIIGVADEFTFHETIEKNSKLLNYFDKVQLEEPDSKEMLQVLQSVIRRYESQREIVFTYQAIDEVLTNTKRYFPDGALPGRAVDLVDHIASWAENNKIGVIGVDEVDAVVEKETKIPVGEIDEKEKEKPLNLETLLHAHVVGQDEAIGAISDSLRRARTDIQTRTRPMGSFLFLGPTGVGKTQTAKALARVFFGGEEHLMRLDMSEFNESDATERLIGSFTTQKPGVLSNLVRTRSYGVLLLDEFEKAHRDTHNLFLRIFDEGIFSDMNGRKINTRNIIFIATSNAGSAQIFRAVSEDEDLSLYKDSLVQTLIKNNIFRAELINRYDAVVLFHPLDKDHLEKIAVMQLHELAKRLQEQNIHLNINEALVSAVIREGYDPKFGAREMRRAIQEKIQNKIAKKMISGELTSGEDLTFTAEELV